MRWNGLTRATSSFLVLALFGGGCAATRAPDEAPKAKAPIDPSADATAAMEEVDAIITSLATLCTKSVDPLVLCPASRFLPAATRYLRRWSIDVDPRGIDPSSSMPRIDVLVACEGPRIDEEAGYVCLELNDIAVGASATTRESLLGNCRHTCARHRAAVEWQARWHDRAPLQPSERFPCAESCARICADLFDTQDTCTCMALCRR